MILITTQGYGEFTKIQINGQTDLKLKSSTLKTLFTVKKNCRTEKPIDQIYNVLLKNTQVYTFIQNVKTHFSDKQVTHHKTHLLINIYKYILTNKYFLVRRKSVFKLYLKNASCQQCKLQHTNLKIQITPISLLCQQCASKVNNFYDIN